MYEKDKLRKADLISGGLLFLFGLWIFAEATGMPMKDSFAGVQNVWYVSPALFPLFIGSALMLMSIALVVNAIGYIGRSGLGRLASGFVAGAREKGLRLSASSIRFAAIVAVLAFYVYLNIPRIDFFLSTVLFLLAAMSMFYFDDEKLIVRLLRFYLTGSVLFFLYFLFGLHAVLTGMFRYSTDVLALLFIVAYGVYAGALAGRDTGLKRRFAVVVALSLATPLVLIPVFKFFLLVPLPVEGGIIKLMSLIRYSLF